MEKGFELKDREKERERTKRLGLGDDGEKIVFNKKARFCTTLNAYPRRKKSHNN